MKTQLLASAALLGLAASAQATVVVNFGSAGYVTGNVNQSRVWAFNGTSPTITSTIAFSTSAALNPSASYSGPAYYGGAVRTNLNDTTAGNSNVVNGAGPTSFDVIQYDAAGGSNTTSQFAAVTYFQKAGFGLTLGQTANITSTSAFTAVGTNNQATGELTARWVIQNTAGEFMISAPAGTFAQSNSYSTLTSGDLTALSWFSYNPASDLTSISSAIATPDFTDVLGVGLAAFKANAGRVQYRLASFSADLSVSAIPEPSSFAALAGLCALGFVASRRCRHG